MSERQESPVCVVVLFCFCFFVNEETEAISGVGAHAAEPQIESSVQKSGVQQTSSVTFASRTLTFITSVHVNSSLYKPNSSSRV